MSTNPSAENGGQTVPDAKLHKGYLWALIIALLAGAWIYFGDETRNLDSRQKMGLWVLEEQYSSTIKKLAGRYTLAELASLCRHASEERGSATILAGLLPKSSESGVVESAFQRYTADVCGAYLYKKRRTQIKRGILEEPEF